MAAATAVRAGGDPSGLKLGQPDAVAAAGDAAGGRAAAAGPAAGRTAGPGASAPGRVAARAGPARDVATGRCAADRRHHPHAAAAASGRAVPEAWAASARHPLAAAADEPGPGRDSVRVGPALAAAPAAQGRDSVAAAALRRCAGAGPAAVAARAALRRADDPAVNRGAGPAAAGDAAAAERPRRAAELAGAAAREQEPGRAHAEVRAVPERRVRQNPTTARHHRCGPGPVERAVLARAACDCLRIHRRVCWHPDPRRRAGRAARRCAGVWLAGLPLLVWIQTARTRSAVRRGRDHAKERPFSLSLSLPGPRSRRAWRRARARCVRVWQVRPSSWVCRWRSAGG